MTVCRMLDQSSFRRRLNSSTSGTELHGYATDYQNSVFCWVWDTVLKSIPVRIGRQTICGWKKKYEESECYASRIRFNKKIIYLPLQGDVWTICITWCRI